MLAITTAIALLAACHPLLLPLLPVVDAVGLDVLALLVVAQALAARPWLADLTRRGATLARRVLAGLLAGAVGGYLRQLLFGGYCRGVRFGQG